jgi:hypothetical protein
LNCTFIEPNSAQTPALAPNKEHWFNLIVVGSSNAGESNVAKFYSGKLNAAAYGIATESDQTAKIDEAIRYLNALGGGTLYFEMGTSCSFLLLMPKTSLSTATSLLMAMGLHSLPDAATTPVPALIPPKDITSAHPLIFACCKNLRMNRRVFFCQHLPLCAHSEL